MFRGNARTETPRETSLNPTDPRVIRINSALAEMRAAFEKRKADPDSILIELTRFADKELNDVPGLGKEHRFSYVKCQIERRILPREDV